MDVVWFVFVLPFDFRESYILVPAEVPTVSWICSLHCIEMRKHKQQRPLTLTVRDFSDSVRLTLKLANINLYKTSAFIHHIHISCDQYSRAKSSSQMYITVPIIYLGYTWAIHRPRTCLVDAKLWSYTKACPMVGPICVYNIHMHTLSIDQNRVNTLIKRPNIIIIHNIRSKPARRTIYTR